ncbi:alpha/beta hydrolase [Streptomyces sp. NPDC051907]|uniref:dienelactone hydrolase family protein n=1 Tax=Streptomyces sp. NPDC051907 TaxID=3155284 RepID=UPI0034257C38
MAQHLKANHWPALLTAALGLVAAVAGASVYTAAGGVRSGKSVEPELIWTTEPTAEAKSGARASLTGYSLSPGLLKIMSDPKRGNPTQVHGVLGMPEGDGPHPVVLVLHGTHPNCVTVGKEDLVARDPVRTRRPLVCADPKNPKEVPGVGPDYLRQDAGLSHIVEALTRKGFVAVSIDVVSPEVWWGGEPDTEKGYTALIDAHLRLLSDLDKGIGHGLKIKDLKGRIDTSRVGLVGHSRGGGYVLTPKAAKRAGLFGAVAIQPEPMAEKASHTVPVLNIRGACDEDTGPQAGLTTMQALATSRSTKVAADVLLAGTGHRMLNTNLSPAPAKDGGCTASELASPAAAQAQVAQLTASFLAQALHQAPAYRLPALDGLTPTGRNLRKDGPSITFAKTSPETFANPHKIPETTSKDRVLPAIPKDLKVNKNPDAGI